MNPVTRLKLDFPGHEKWIEDQYKKDFGSGDQPPDDAEWAVRMRNVLKPPPSFTGKRLPIKRKPRPRS
jgi:hypothetical protein